jgi:hypothetical protein
MPKPQMLPYWLTVAHFDCSVNRLVGGTTSPTTMA